MCETSRPIIVGHKRYIASRVRYLELLARHVDAKRTDASIRGNARALAACEACRKTLAEDRLRLETLQTGGGGTKRHTAVCADATIEDARAAFDRFLCAVASTDRYTSHRHR